MNSMKKLDMINIYTGILMGSFLGNIMTLEDGQWIAESYVENLFTYARKHNRKIITWEDFIQERENMENNE